MRDIDAQFSTATVSLRLEDLVAPYALWPCSRSVHGIPVRRSAEAAAPGAFVAFDQVLDERTPSRKEIDFVGPHLTTSMTTAERVWVVPASLPAYCLDRRAHPSPSNSAGTAGRRQGPFS